MLHNRAILHRAPLVVPVAGPVIENGAVLSVDHKIEQIGSFDSLKSCGAEIIDHEDSVLVPALINCHAHIELSFLKELGRDNSFFAPGDITAWIYSLLHKRAELSGNSDSELDAGRQAVKDMCRSGIAAIADIGNVGLSKDIGNGLPVTVKFFLEAFGLSKEEVPEVLKRLAEFEQLSWTGHAPYSTSPELIVSLKKRAGSRGELFSIHTAESADEIEFLQNGKGRFAEFLDKRLGETGGGWCPFH